jgi:hypothetical protein
VPGRNGFGPGRDHDCEVTRAKRGGGEVARAAVGRAGPAATGLGQGTFRMEHENMGVVDLFIVPVERYGEQIRYQAVFNCVTSKAAP